MNPFPTKIYFKLNVDQTSILSGCFISVIFICTYAVYLLNALVYREYQIKQILADRGSRVSKLQRFHLYTNPNQAEV